MNAPLPRGAHYVAMGSSFGAGPGLKPRAAGSPRAAGRSAANYAHHFAEAGSLELVDVTFSGATTADILAPSRSALAQLDAVTRGTRLVTITAGGNDIGYLPAITLSSFPWPFRALPALRKRVEEIVDVATLAPRLEALEDDLATIVERIRERAPDSRVVIVDYLTILPADLTLIGRVPSNTVAEWALAAAAGLTNVFSTAAQRTNADALPVAARSKDHHAWAAEPWTRRFHYSLRGGAPYHPNARGMAAVSGMLAQLLGTEERG